MEKTEERYELTGSGIDEAGEAAYRFLTAAYERRKTPETLRPWSPHRTAEDDEW